VESPVGKPGRSSHQTWLDGEPRAESVGQFWIVEVGLVSFDSVEKVLGAPRIEHFLAFQRMQVLPIGQDNDVVESHGYGIQARPDHGASADGRPDAAIPASRICAT
jgi:hypothetical protein